MHNLESRLSAIESRNASVESDKAWETSHTRKISILIMTYAILGLYMKHLGIQLWYLHALVPTCGYFLSTLALPVVRKLWQSSAKCKIHRAELIATRYAFGHISNAK